MKMTNTKAMAVGAALGVGLLVVLAAVPSQTDFSNAYFKTNALPITLQDNISLNGYLSLSGATNRVTMSGGSLQVDGVAVGGLSPLSITFTNGLYNVKTADRFVVNDGGTNILPSATSFGKNNSITIKSYTTNGSTVWIQNATDTIDFSITNEALAFPTSHNYMSDGTNNWMRW